MIDYVKGFVKSINIWMVWNCIWMAFWILPINDWTAVLIDLPFLKQFWASDKILISYKEGIMLLYINISNILVKTGIIDIGAQYLMSYLSPFLYKGFNFAVFHTSGKTTEYSDKL